MPKRKNLSPQARHAEKQLQHWGRWRQHQMPPQLEYAQRNILYDLMQAGVRIKATAKIESHNKRAEKIDALINQLCQHHPKIAKVLNCHYTEEGPIRRKAAMLRLPKSTYHDLLHQGLRWIGYQLCYVRASLLELIIVNQRMRAKRCQWP